MIEFQDAKDKYISRRYDWKNFIYFRSNSIKNVHKEEDGDRSRGKRSKAPNKVKPVENTN